MHLCEEALYKSKVIIIIIIIIRITNHSLSPIIHPPLSNTYPHH